jgi:ABC-type multidrug transport system ATPase subunit
MITSVRISNFKLFEDVELELGERVVFVGPNNSGKTSALQAIALWALGAQRWTVRHGFEEVASRRAGVTINRRDLLSVPVPRTSLLWKDLHVRDVSRANGSQQTSNVLITIDVKGQDSEGQWRASIDFDLANNESIYCRSSLGTNGMRLPVPEKALTRIGYLPPMSGLAANETELTEGAVAVRIGEGRTAEVLRNLCYKAHQDRPDQWKHIKERMKDLFGIVLHDPEPIPSRGEIEMQFELPSRVVLDVSSSGRGQQQTLLLLAYMAAHPGAVLLLDEPDAHLEVLRQRQIYDVISRQAEETRSQVIMASHSEILLQEAVSRDSVVAFVGKPHTVQDRGAQVTKALLEIGYDQYLQAEERRWVLYLEGSSDFAMLKALAEKVQNQDAIQALDMPLVHYVGNQRAKAESHFYGLREAVPGLRGICILDHDASVGSDHQALFVHRWQRREIENYVCQNNTLIAWARGMAVQSDPDKELEGLISTKWEEAMVGAITEIEQAFSSLGRPSPWSAETKASTEFLEPLFQNFYRRLGLQNTMAKAGYYELVPFIPLDEIDDEVKEVLRRVGEVANPS